MVDKSTRKKWAEIKAEGLIQQIHENPGIRLPCHKSPLLCTIIGLIHRHGGTLPQQKVELYKLCIDTFIFNWEMHKRRKDREQDSLDKDETQHVLEAIALHLHVNTEENHSSRDAL